MGEIAEHITNQMQAGKYHSSKTKESKMQVTGTIRSVCATQDGGYQGPSGYVYTFDMVIDTPQGAISGRIGSKKQPYPLAVGQPITVELTETDRGPTLKKINPQYANQPQGAPPPQSGQQPAPQQAQAPPQRIPSEWDKPVDWHDKKQLLIVRQSSISNAIELLSKGDSEHVTVEQTLIIAKQFSKFVYDGVVLGETGQPSAGQDQTPPADEDPTQPEDPY